MFYKLVILFATVSLISASGAKDKDPCYKLAKETNNLGKGKLKWDDGKNSLVCFDGNGSVKCTIGYGKKDLTFKCGAGADTGSDSGAPNMLLPGIALSFAATFIAL